MKHVLNGRCGLEDFGGLELLQRKQIQPFRLYARVLEFTRILNYYSITTIHRVRKLLPQNMSSRILTISLD